MCVRYNRDLGRVERWIRELGVWIPEAYSSPETVDNDSFPGEGGPIVLPDPDHGRRVVAAKWGLMPFWAKEPSFGKKSAYNARRETVAEKPTFRDAYKSRRCLVPATGFYERSNGRWLKLAPSDGSVFAIAGLFEEPNKLSEQTTYTMITTDPNEVVEEFHDRMPVVLRPDDYEAWLSLDSNPKELLALLLPCDPDLLTVTDAGKIGEPRIKKDSLFEA